MCGSKTHTDSHSSLPVSGFDDALLSLDKLTKMTFHLPVDLAVRPFNNIRDAF